MTAAPIKRLLKAEENAPFMLHFGLDDVFVVDDRKRCQLDEQDLILYVSFPAGRVPDRFKQIVAATECAARVEVIDLRLVRRVTVNAERMPGATNI